MATTSKAKSMLPGEGERAARRGYVHQDRFSARLIYTAILDRSLQWVGLADRSAGIADDCVLGLRGEVVGYQFKRSEQPTGFGIRGLLLGKEGAVADLAASFMALRRQFPRERMRLRFLTTDYPSTNDRLVRPGKPATGKWTTAAFLDEWARNRGRTVAEWRRTDWRPVIEELFQRSALSEAEFDAFWTGFEIVSGSRAAPFLNPAEDAGAREQIEELARALGTLIADHGDKDRWTRAELLTAVGWPDHFGLRFAHDFPVGAYVQRNEVTEIALGEALRAHSAGYLALVGPPGAGKSTLLQRELSNHPGFAVARYLAFVPGSAQGQGRGEADNFYDDLNAQLSDAGLRRSRVRDSSTSERQEQFEYLLSQAGKRHEEDGSRFLIVVDGLDHIPREELPHRSLLEALPLPAALPPGVLVVLGTQRLDLPGVPDAVRRQAAEKARLIEIAPLPLAAVFGMADRLGLHPKISREGIFDVTRGHPLVTRYLIERLKEASLDEQSELLSGSFSFGGDLKDVYDAAWRAIETAPYASEVRKVLALIAYAQGPIEPALLARATSESAVEWALRAVHHLLMRGTRGWTVFHNSFRLYLQEKPIERFGEPDPEFTSPAIYRRLAELTANAEEVSGQRWLSFRYRYLAGDVADALAIANREYFVRQYIEGRPPWEIRGDIRDTARALKARPDPVKLFDLLLAADEVDRRAQVMEGATSLVDAYIALGDLDAAEGALDEPHPADAVWKVIDALLEAGQPERARLLFDKESPFAGLSQQAPRLSVATTRAALPWARRAVLFLDPDQIEAVFKQKLGTPELEPDKEDRARLEAGLRLQVARAYLERSRGEGLEETSARWSVSEENIPELALAAAKAASRAGDSVRARELLNDWADKLDPLLVGKRQVLRAASMALDLGEFEIARLLAASVPPTSLAEVDPVFRFERIGAACATLITAMEIRAALGEPMPALVPPAERLLKGLQHHLAALGQIQGELRTEACATDASLVAIVTAALRFLAQAHRCDEDDWSMSHIITSEAETIGDAILSVARRSKGVTDALAREYDVLASAEKGLIRWWPSFRRKLVMGVFRLDGDAVAAAARLESALRDLEERDPREELEQRVQFAKCFAEIGEQNRSRLLLGALRENALGTYLPAKKDGQYELWVDLLQLANRADPAARAERAAVAQQLVAGLSQTEGSDSGHRISRHVLFELMACEIGQAWSAASWAASSGIYAWDGIVDCLLRGLLVRRPDLAEPALVAWCHLALPWYSEPYGSTTSTGQFLRDAVAAASDASLERFEATAVAAIGELARPPVKLRLLRVLHDALKARNRAAAVTIGEISRWAAAPRQTPPVHPDERDFSHILTFEELENALASEPRDEPVSMPPKGYSRVSYPLRRAAIRLIETAPWTAVRAFIEAHSTLVQDWDVAIAAARIATQEGDRSAAERLLRTEQQDEHGGWSWPSDRGRYRLHQARHLIGEKDAFEAALKDFLEDMEASRYSLTTTLWSIDMIFPLLFEAVPWPELWERLAAQLRSSRDYRGGKPVPPVEGPTADEDLIPWLLCWALMLGATALREEAARGAREFAAAGWTPILIQTVDRLLELDGEAAALGMELLARCHSNPDVAEAFQGRLDQLGGHGDIAVAAAASYLGERLGTPVPLEIRKLPPFYSLHLPQFDEVHGPVAANERTRGLVLDDPLAWTEGWASVVRRLSEASGVSETKIRWRAGQFLASWGGVAKFGHPASERLEADLSRLNFKITYRRPQAEAALRALRWVACELWRAGLIEPRQVRMVLYEVRADPDYPEWPSPVSRPVDQVHPPVPRMMWEEEQKKWLEEVVTDVERDCCSPHILAEWSVERVREIRREATLERWVGAAKPHHPEEGLDGMLDELPVVLWFGGPVPLYERAEMDISATAIFQPRRLDGGPTRVLIFCPLLAAELGWVSDDDAPYIYRDSAGRETARTIWWREGLAQPVDEEEVRAEGQQVILTEEGRRALHARRGPLQLCKSAWRRSSEGGQAAISKYAIHDG